MTVNQDLRSKIRKFGYSSFLIAILLLAAATLVLYADDTRVKVGTIDAIAKGTSTQMGQIVNVKITINQFSTEDDEIILIEKAYKGKKSGSGTFGDGVNRSVSSATVAAGAQDVFRRCSRRCEF